MVCIVCDQVIKRSEWTKECHVCSSFIHAKCCDELKSLTTLGRDVFSTLSIKEKSWLCQRCIPEVNMSTNVKDMEKKLIGMDKKIECLIAETKQSAILNEKSEEKISSFFTEGNFADVLKKSTKKVSSQVITIKPKNDNQSANETKNALAEIINPSEYGVVGSGRIAKNGFKVICDKKENREKLVNEMKAKLGNDFLIGEPRERYHRMKIFSAMVKKSVYLNGDDNKLKLQEIEMNIKDENKKLRNDDKAKVIMAYVKPKRSNENIICIDIVMQVSADNYRHYVTDKNKVCVEWKFCHADVGIHVSRCMKCLAFGHKKEQCTRDKVCCAKCGDDHLGNTCQKAELKCINCVKFNKRVNKNVLDIGHNALSSECPSLKHQKDKIASSISE